MIESSGEDGSTVQIVYRNGGDLRASAVEMLCDKVSCTCCFYSHGSSRSGASSTHPQKYCCPKRT